MHGPSNIVIGSVYLLIWACQDSAVMVDTVKFT